LQGSKFKKWLPCSHYLAKVSSAVGSFFAVVQTEGATMPRHIRGKPAETIMLVSAHGPQVVQA
jgi:hypothetical protein